MSKQESFNTGFDSLATLPMRTMVTVNGEFQPQADIEKEGWQSLTQQSIQPSFLQYQPHSSTKQKKTSIYIYGGRPSISTDKTSIRNHDEENRCQRIADRLQPEVVSLAPGKRADILFYLPKGDTEIASTYSYDDGSETNNMGGYPNLTTTAKNLKEDRFNTNTTKASRREQRKSAGPPATRQKQTIFSKQ